MRILFVSSGHLYKLNFSEYFQSLYKFYILLRSSEALFIGEDSDHGNFHKVSFFACIQNMWVPFRYFNKVSVSTCIQNVWVPSIIIYNI
jgi:hypothetical protein